jgi:hypothetical protein
MRPLPQGRRINHSETMSDNSESDTKYVTLWDQLLITLFVLTA